MITGTCHCGACRYTYDATPPWAISCNCSVCRRLGAMWLHGSIAQITVTGPTTAYAWGDKDLAFHSCQICGCTTHWENLTSKAADARMAVNLRLAAPDAAKGLRVRHFDGADSWEFLD